MRVAHIVAHPPFREGTGTACYYNARALQALGCEVEVYAPRLPGVEQTALEVPYHFLRSYLSLGNAYLTPSILSIPPVDILHLHYPFVFGAELTLWRARQLHVPLVITYHSDLYGKGLRRLAFWLYNHLIAPAILRQARKIGVVSLDHAVHGFFGPTIFARRQADLVEIGNGVDVETFDPALAVEDVRPRYGLAKEDFVLLFVSSLDAAHRRKGLDVLLEALASLPDLRWKLLVVGDGNCRAAYEHQARDLGLGERVRFAGRISHAAGTMTAHYAAADVVIMPSLMQESFSLSLAQGMAMGKAVIGSDMAGVRTLVAECGLLIPPGDRQALAEGIRRLYQDPALRQRLGASGRARILARYTWCHVGERLLSMYYQVLEQA